MEKLFITEKMQDIGDILTQLLQTIKVSKHTVQTMFFSLF
jgi:hypothetical protein